LPNISASSWGVYKKSNPTELLFGFGVRSKREIASISKVMTCIICLDLIKEIECDPSDTYIQVNSRAASIKGTTAKLKKSDIISVTDLLFGLMLPSGNNAAYSLAENFGEYLKEKYLSHGDSITQQKLKYKSHMEVFVKEMNNYATRLNLKSTSFYNPHGLTAK